VHGTSSGIFGLYGTPLHPSASSDAVGVSAATASRRALQVIPQFASSSASNELTH
jgi:hypothetical protein